MEESMWTVKKHSIVAAFALPLALSLSCATTFKSIVANPTQYRDKEISIAGKVTKAVSIPLIPVRLYELYDGTETLLMISAKATEHGQNERIDSKARVFVVASGTAASESVDSLATATANLLSEKGLASKDAAKKIAGLVSSFVGDALKGRNIGLVLLED
jgi:hypothetical protein